MTANYRQTGIPLQNSMILHDISSVSNSMTFPCIGLFSAIFSRFPEPVGTLQLRNCKVSFLFTFRPRCFIPPDKKYQELKMAYLISWHHPIFDKKQQIF